ncbi:MAG: heavy metal-responsive transcriptional regulator [Terriglobales bacterium]
MKPHKGVAVPMKIGQAAKDTGLTVDTIRFYERQGLLAHPPRTEGGFRLYSGRDLSALRFIRSVQGLGFSLEEIGVLLSLRSGNTQACSAVRDLLAGKLVQVRAKIGELQELERDLDRALRKCSQELRRGRKPAARCPILAENGARPQEERG